MIIIAYLPEERLAFAYNDDIQHGTFGCTCNSGVPTYCKSIPITGLKYLGGFKNIPGQALEVSSFVWCHLELIDRARKISRFQLYSSKES